MSAKFVLDRVRNIGISAHIDSGKTTLTERILFYTGKIHKIGEIRSATGATMDSRPDEIKRGITISSAATTVSWNGSLPSKNIPDTWINIIDTPGHVDFTVEVERSLRVLDGAILVLCAVGGVQSQSITVDRQMKRYQTPRIAFINKIDRAGANPKGVTKQIREKLGINGVPLQIPIGLGNDLEGVVDVIAMKAYRFEGEKGKDTVEIDIPAELVEEAKKTRTELLDSLSMYNDQIMELALEEKEVPDALIHQTIRKATLAQEFVPVMMGSAYKNTGVQLLLDAVERYLPSPLDRTMKATDIESKAEDKTIQLKPDPKAPACAMAFKLIDEPTGQITYMRVYQGTIRKGEGYTNSRSGKAQRFSRIQRVHADEREDIESASAGDIVAVVGVDCASGDTYTGNDKRYALENIFAPKPVISLAIAPSKRVDSDKLGKALQRFRREDPTFHVGTDSETNETIISGMGELHLEIYTDRIKNEYGVEVTASPPKVSYREAPTQRAAFDCKRKKQTGGSGQYGHIVGHFDVLPDDAPEQFVFEDKVAGGRIPSEYIPSVEKGFRSMIDKGPVAGYEVVGLKVELEDGSYHDVDSSDMAFQLTARECFREQFNRTKPVILEPIMKVEIEVPSQFEGGVNGNVAARRGVIQNTDARDGFSVIVAEVPLANMFGYSTDLRSATQGKGTFTMEFAKYAKVPNSIQEEIVAKAKAEREAKNK